MLCKEAIHKCHFYYSCCFRVFFLQPLLLKWTCLKRLVLATFCICDELIHTHTHTHLKPASSQPFGLLFVLKPFLYFRPPPASLLSHIAPEPHSSNSWYNTLLCSIIRIQSISLILFATHNIVFLHLAVVTICLTHAMLTPCKRVRANIGRRRRKRRKKFSLNVTFNWNKCLIKINNWAQFQSTMLYKRT